MVKTARILFRIARTVLDYEIIEDPKDAFCESRIKICRANPAYLRRRYGTAKWSNFIFQYINVYLPFTDLKID